MTEHLDAFERAQLVRAERTIKRGLRTFVAVGEALLEIRDQRLYRGTHSTFEDYCRDRWQLSKTHGNRLVQAAQVLRELPPGPKPGSERQARELAGLLRDPAALREVWGRVVASGRPTAATIRDAVRATIDHPEKPAMGSAGATSPADALPAPPAGEVDHSPDTSEPEPQPVNPDRGPESGGPEKPRRPDGDAGGASPPVDPPAGGEAAEPTHDGPLLTEAEIHEALTDALSPHYLEGEGCRLALVHVAGGAALDRAVAGATRQSRLPGRLPARVREVLA